MLYERAMKVWPGNYASLTNWAALLWDQVAPHRRQGDGARERREDRGV